MRCWGLFQQLTSILLMVSCEKDRRIAFNSTFANEKVLPNTTVEMGDVVLLMQALEDGIPFGYAHFNDGEIEAITCREGNDVDFGWQRCSNKLNSAMLNALTNPAPNFYVGIACLCAFRGIPYLKGLHHLGISHNLPINLHQAKPDHENCPHESAKLDFGHSLLKPGRLTVATMWTDGNFEYAMKEMLRILNKAHHEQGRRIHIVIGEGDGHHHETLPFPVSSVQKTTTWEAFDNSYDSMHTIEFLQQAGYEMGDIVLIMCGPLGRILASEWALLRWDITFLDMGSFWDGYLWSRNYDGLKGQWHPCMFRNDSGVAYIGKVWD